MFTILCYVIKDTMHTSRRHNFRYKLASCFLKNALMLVRTGVITLKQQFSHKVKVHS